MIILVSLWNIFLWLDCCAHVDLHAPKPTQISLHHARFSHLLLIYALLSIGYASWLLKVKILPIHWISWLLFNTRSSFDGRIWMASPKKTSEKWNLVKMVFDFDLLDSLPLHFQPVIWRFGAQNFGSISHVNIWGDLALTFNEHFEAEKVWK